MNLEVGILLLVSRPGACTGSFYLWEKDRGCGLPWRPCPNWGGLMWLRHEWSKEMREEGASGLQGPGKGQARRGRGSGGGGGASTHVLGGKQGNNEAFGDCAGSTPGFPACPLCGLDPGGCLGAGQGALNGPLVSALGVGQAPRAHSALARSGRQPPWLPPPAG